MAFTEIKKRNTNKYYYRVISIRKGNSVSKKRKYLGVNLSDANLALKEKQADKMLIDNKALQKIIPKIRKVLLEYNVQKAGIFGSYAKGKQRKDSDIDILIDPPKGMGFGFSGIQMKLEHILKKKIDLVSYNGLSPFLKDEILKHEVKII